jgi:hypothetical protein
MKTARWSLLAFAQRAAHSFDQLRRPPAAVSVAIRDSERLLKGERLTFVSRAVNLAHKAITGGPNLRLRKRCVYFSAAHAHRGGPAMNSTATIAIYNVQYFADLLGSSADPVKRAMVMRLLIEEENKLGAGQEALDIAETRIANGRTLIERQEALVARVRENGHDVRAHNDLLATLVKVQAAFERYRRTIMRGLNNRII